MRTCLDSLISRPEVNITVAVTLSGGTRPTCYAVVSTLIQNYSVALRQRQNIHGVVQDCVLARLVERGRRLPESHEVDVHVGGAHPEGADVFVQWIFFKPHGTEERHGRKLVVKNILAVNYPNS